MGGRGFFRAELGTGFGRLLGQTLELLFDFLGEFFADFRVGDFVEVGLHEALDEEFFGLATIEAAGHEVEKEAFVGAADGGGVAGGDIVGFDFEAGFGVGVGFWAEH